MLVCYMFLFWPPRPWSSRLHFGHRHPMLSGLSSSSMHSLSEQRLEPAGSGTDSSKNASNLMDLRRVREKKKFARGFRAREERKKGAKTCFQEELKEKHRKHDTYMEVLQLPFLIDSLAKKRLLLARARIFFLSSFNNVPVPARAAQQRVLALAVERLPHEALVRAHLVLPRLRSGR